MANVDHIAQNLDKPLKETEKDVEEIIAFVERYPEDFEDFQDLSPNDLYDADIINYLKDNIYILLKKLQINRESEIEKIMQNEDRIKELYNYEYKLKSLVLSCIATKPESRNNAAFIKNFVLTEAATLDKEQKLEFEKLFQAGILDQVEQLINNHFHIEQIMEKLNLVNPLPEFVARKNELSFRAEKKAN